jgi:hypothetical protein
VGRASALLRLPRRGLDRPHVGALAGDLPGDPCDVRRPHGLAFLVEVSDLRIPGLRLALDKRDKRWTSGPFGPRRRYTLCRNGLRRVVKRTSADKRSTATPLRYRALGVHPYSSPLQAHFFLGYQLTLDLLTACPGRQKARQIKRLSADKRWTRGQAGLLSTVGGRRHCHHLRTRLTLRLNNPAHALFTSPWCTRITPVHYAPMVGGCPGVGGSKMLDSPSSPYRSGPRLRFDAVIGSRNPGASNRESLAAALGPDFKSRRPRRFLSLRRQGLRRDLPNSD